MEEEIIEEELNDTEQDNVETEEESNDNSTVINNNIDLSEINSRLENIYNILNETNKTIEKFSDINSYLEHVSTALTPNNKTIVRNCALTLFANINFDNNKKSPIQIAKECVDRAFIIANELESRNLLSEDKN